VEPITLAAVTTPVLQEGIKCLVGLAGDALRRWRERREARRAAGALDAEAPIQTTTDPGVLPDVFEGKVGPLQIHFDKVEKLDEAIRDLRRELADYADGIEPVDAGNKNLLEVTDALRQGVEAIYQQRFTFKGENRPPSGPVVEGDIDVKDVLGRVTAVRARLISGGHVRGTVRADRVDAGAEAIGVEADTIE
jgi:hypothetical protein